MAEYFHATSTTATSTFAGGLLAGNNSAFILDATSPANSLYVASNGNIGVGTSSPWGLLSVNANGLIAGAPQFVVGSSTNTNLIVANNGYVGIGTTTVNSTLTVSNANTNTTKC